MNFQLLLPTAFNSHHPRFMALALRSEQHIHLFCFGAAELEALRQYLFTDPAPALWRELEVIHGLCPA